MEPGPGVGGPGPGVMAPSVVPASAMGGVTAAGGVAGGVACGDGMVSAAGAMMPAGAPNIQVLFNRPDGMEIHYDVIGDGTFGSEPLYVPGRMEFGQGGIYRLKLTNIQGREGVELYPTVEIAAGSPRTGAYLAHNAIPLQFNPDDFEQVLSGNFVTKVIYLPDPEFQGSALVGVNVLVSNRLAPGLDPIVEADRRGSILAIIRIGNKDIEMSGMSAAGGMAMAGGAPIMCGPDGAPIGGIPASLPGYVAGVTAPQYGMTMSGTPIGLAGPPHIPLGTPAGLTSHVMKNTTRRHIPAPVSNMRIKVNQRPGQSYPKPPNRISVHETNMRAPGPNTRPLVGSQSVSGASGEYCPPQ